MTREEAVALLERYSNYDGMGIPNLAGCKEAMKVAAEALKEAYPELAESEDERIRRTLVEYFGPEVQLDFVRGVPIQKIRDWLEKQKEQKSLHWRRIEDATTQRTDDGCCVTSEKMLVKGWINDGDYRIVDEGTMVNRDILCIPVRELNAEQKEQKPELSRPHKGDDTNPYDMSVSEAQEYAIKRGFGVPFNDGEVYVDERHITQTIGNILRWADEHPKEQKPWKVGANAYFTPEQKPAEYIKRNSKEWYSLLAEQYDKGFWKGKAEQKPAEWSEEDENARQNLIAHFEGKILRLSGEAKKDAVDWLKSLRPSWKPSEEQMEALLNTLHPDDPYYPELKSLYEQLKKL